MFPIRAHDGVNDVEVVVSVTARCTPMSSEPDSYKATTKQRIIAGVLVTVLLLAVVAAVMRMFV
ncbi:hypothetical protein GCM10017774_22970 [Lentzea cavernae]|uniref:Uncharacterized protein n=1 Tax=Lentzea cavernae TaxID=2020703 RepID=A0ABQ3M994_9PSEU|nr:hypothetical protein GCM10017774_22970 [Lentzea cavernae]